MSEIDKLVGENIQKRRERMNKTRRQFADAVSITEDDLVDFEGGMRRPPAQTLGRIARELGCEPIDLQIKDDT